MDRRPRHVSSASPLNSTAPRVPPPPAPLTRSYSSNARLYGNTGASNDLAVSTDASTRQLAQYCETLEADHADLRSAFNEQHNTINSLTSLMGENKFKSTAVRSLETRLGQYEAFVAELHNLMTEDRGLRVRPDANQSVAVKSKAPVAHRVPITASASGDGAPPLDLVRQAVQESQLQLRQLSERNAKLTAALKVLEDERKATAKAERVAGAGSAEAPASGIETPASAQTQQSLRQKVSTLEQRLVDAEKDNRKLVTQLQQRDVALKEALSAMQVKDDELRSANERVSVNESLLEDVRTRCLEAERRHARMVCSTEIPDTTSNSKGGRLVLSPISHLLTGTGYARAFRRLPEGDLRAALTLALSRAMHVPTTHIAKLDVQPSRDGVCMTCTVRHADCVDTAAMQQLLLEYPFNELTPLKDRAADSVEDELSRTEAALENQMKENATMQRQVRELEATVERLNRERSAQDAEINNAIDETALTVREMHTALKREQESNARLSELLGAEQSRVVALEAQLRAQEASVQSVQQARATSEASVRTLESKVKQLTAEKAAVEKKMSALISTHAEETAAMEQAQRRRETERSADQDGRLRAVEEALDAARGDVRQLQERLEASQHQLLEAQAARDELDTKLKSALAEATQVERALDSALFRKGHAARPSSSTTATQTLPGKARTLSLELTRADKETQEAKADLEREKQASLRAQQDALAAATQQSSQSVAALQKANAALTARLRAQEQLAEEAQRRHTAEVAALNEAAAAAEEEQKTLSRQQQGEEGKKTAQLQRDLSAVKDAARKTQEEMEMKIIALEGLLEAEREQRELEKKKLSAATENVTASRELQREVRTLKRDKEALAEQVAELETDLADFAQMREELQTSLEMAEKQLRAKKHDFDLLVKQLLRLEENERSLKEENQSLRGSLAASPRAETVDVLNSNTGPGKQPLASGGAGGSPGHSPSTALNAPSRLTPRRGLKSPKGASSAALKRSPTSPVTVVAQPRVLKRNTSVKSFSRTASQPVVAAASADVSPDKLSRAGKEDTGAAFSGTTHAAGATADMAEKRFQRSHTATSSATTAAATRDNVAAFEAPPRLNDFHRQGSSRGHYTNIQPAPLSANARVSGGGGVDRPASSTRRHPSSPSGASTGPSRSTRGSAETLKRQHSTADSLSASGGALKRTSSSFLAAAAGNSASFVRTPSGYRRVQH